MAYEFCHEFTSIFDMQLSKREGKRQMRKWMHTVRASALRCFDSFLTTLEKYFDDIANYFIDRHTSGFVEGFNDFSPWLKPGVSWVTPSDSDEMLSVLCTDHLISPCLKAG